MTDVPPGMPSPNRPLKSSLARILDLWRDEPTIIENIAQWHTEPEKPAQFNDFPSELHPALVQACRAVGIPALYSHQFQTWQAVKARQNVVIVTDTASGKTLSYNLPVLDLLLQYPSAKALYLFPTKALTYDQKQGLVNFIQQTGRYIQNPKQGLPFPAVYDGDTPAHQRTTIRTQANILLTNPDMLHTGILPHHTNWANFLQNLQFVVVDEIHSYRGVFGSHLANVIRRLKRILRFYGASPLFILTSATIANPGEHAHRLIEAPVTVIDQNGAPRGARHFLLYNPPIVQPELGLRRSAMQESIRLAGDLLTYKVQTLIFGRARRTVEILLRNLQHAQSSQSSELRAYRSGYLPAQRREIESGLRSGEVRAVVSTNALELGVDIGNMDAVLLVGYPGTIAATRQQAGRAGRRKGDSLAVFVASAGPLDQYLIQHPEYLLQRTPETALINPDNPLILLQHLRCAAFEMAFTPGEGFGSLPENIVNEYLNFLMETGDLHQAGGRYFWMADAYPAAQISLRSASATPVLLQINQDDRAVTIGEIDQPSACWMAHPQAIYLQEGVTYLVNDLDLENSIARLERVETDYYTEPQKETSVEKISGTAEETTPRLIKGWGEILVTSKVTGYRRIRWFTQEVLGAGQVDLPPSQLRTTGFWLIIPEAVVEQLRSLNLWTNDPNNYGPNWLAQRNRARERDRFQCQICGLFESDKSHHVHHKIPFRNFTSYLLANQIDNLITLCPSCHKRVETAVRMRSGLSGLSYVLNHLAPLFLMCDSTDLGDYTEPECQMTGGQPTVVIYDKVPAGIGLSESLYNLAEDLLERALELVVNCECRDGCPSCVGPAGENGYGGKRETLAMLQLLNGKIPQVNDGQQGIAFG